MANKVESLLECSVCLETLNDPRTLPCFHSFCKVCLEKIVRTERKKAKSAKLEDFNCPTCRCVFNLKSNQEVAELSSSHFIRNMLEAVQLQNRAKHANCSKCNKQAASCRCLTCEFFLCDGCLAEHNSVRDSWPCFKKISCSVLSVEELAKPENQSKLKGSKVLHCSKHEGKKLKFYCETCKELICRYCMDFIHTRPDHECAPTEHVVEKRKESLKSSVSALEKKLVCSNETLQVISDMTEKFKLNAQKVKESINNDKEQVKDILLQQLEENAQKKCDEVDEVYNQTQEVIAMQQNEIQSLVNEINVSYDLAKNILENGTSAEIIESEAMVTERFGSVERREKTKTVQINDGEIEFIKEPFGIDVKQLQTFLKFGDVKLKGFQCAYVNLATDSKILKGKPGYIRQMIEWLAEQNFEWRLCYRASLNGWKAKDFHLNCDNKGPTVVFVRVGNFIFGGFTDKNWSVHNFVGKSEKSFIFSLSNNANLPPFKSILRKDKSCIVKDSGYGAIFGSGTVHNGRDISISNNASSSVTSFSDFGVSYTLPEGYVAKSDEARSLLAGSFKFTPTEVEVFY